MEKSDFCKRFMGSLALGIVGYRITTRNMQEDGDNHTLSFLFEHWGTSSVTGTTKPTFMSWHPVPVTNVAILRNVLFANMCQLWVSIMYLIINNILTKQCVANELIEYLEVKKPLRVKEPHKGSEQKSSYFISLPWAYGIPLMGIFILLHWLVSKSLFVVQTSAYQPGPHGRRNPN